MVLKKKSSLFYTTFGQPMGNLEKFMQVSGRSQRPLPHRALHVSLKPCGRSCSCACIRAGVPEQECWRAPLPSKVLWAKAKK